MLSIFLQILWCFPHMTDMCSSILTWFFFWILVILVSSCLASPVSSALWRKRQCLSVLAFAYLLKRMPWWFIVNYACSKIFIDTLYQDMGCFLHLGFLCHLCLSWRLVVTFLWTFSCSCGFGNVWIFFFNEAVW